MWYTGICLQTVCWQTGTKTVLSKTALSARFESTVFEKTAFRRSGGPCSSSGLLLRVAGAKASPSAGGEELTLTLQSVKVDRKKIADTHLLLADLLSSFDKKSETHLLLVC